MDNGNTSTRSKATLRLVRSNADIGAIVVDGLIDTPDSSGNWPSRGTPISLRLERPQARWLGDALAKLLREWAEENAVVTALLVRTPTHVVARVMRDRSHIALELLAAV